MKYSSFVFANDGLLALRGTLAAVTVLLSSLCNALASDIDEDGLEDSFEQELLDRYRPDYFFHHDEDHWPASITWLVSHSEVRGRPCNNVVLSNAELMNNPLSILGLSGAQCGSPLPPSSRVAYPELENWRYRLDVMTDFHSGQGLDVGLYGHVVPLSEPVSYVNVDEPIPVGPDYLLVQYWQLFANNDSHASSCCAWWCGPLPCGPGDHEGDWLYLDLYVDRYDGNALRYAVWHHHGDGNCAPTVWEWPYGAPSGYVPKCYIEEDSHEWWPFASDGGECIFEGPLGVDVHSNESHDGSGLHMRPSSVLNVGEDFAPMPGIEPAIFLFYNGRWGHSTGDIGDPPFGPLSQFFPRPPSWHTRYISTAEANWEWEHGLGSRYHPYQFVDDACNAVAQGGRVLIAPGVYHGTYTLDKAATLEVWGPGTVTLGQ